jgi:hypothetical protein
MEAQHSETANAVIEIVQDHLRAWLVCGDATRLDLLCGMFRELSEEFEFDKHAVHVFLSDFKTYLLNEEAQVEED